MLLRYVLGIFLQAWVNEKAAPTLLPYAKDEVTELLDRVVQQESAAREMGRDNLTKHFLLHIFQVEVRHPRPLIT